MEGTDDRDLANRNDFAGLHRVFVLEPFGGVMFKARLGGGVRLIARGGLRFGFMIVGGTVPEFASRLHGTRALDTGVMLELNSSR